jgi:hypothetical protein
LIARRVDKAFFMRAKDDSELYKIFNVSNTPHVVLFRRFENNNVHFNSSWTPEKLERWIVRNSAPTVFEYDMEFSYHVFVHRYPTVFFFRDNSKP